MKTSISHSIKTLAIAAPLIGASLPQVTFAATLSDDELLRVAQGMPMPQIGEGVGYVETCAANSNGNGEIVGKPVCVMRFLGYGFIITPR